MPCASAGAHSDFMRHTLVASPTALQGPARKKARRLFCAARTTFGVSCIGRCSPHGADSKLAGYHRRTVKVPQSKPCAALSWTFKHGEHAVRSTPFKFISLPGAPQGSQILILACIAFSTRYWMRGGLM